MQFLDAIGLASFWEKIKNWVNINYLSLTGGTIRGSVSFLNEADGGKSIRIDPPNITNSKYGVNYLFASGKMIPIGEANGVAGLDSNGNVPLAQLGNLDTTVAEVVTALPTSNIKRHIYLVKDSDTANNKYAEYVYTGDISAAYDSTKWEKLGDFRATVDLANYAKKSEIPTKVSQLSNDKGYLTSHQSLADYAKKSETVDISTIRVEEKVLDVTPQGQILQQVIYFLNFNGTIKEVVIKDATSNMSGFMSIRDKNKLDGIANNANNYSLPTASSTTKGGITLGYSQSGKNYPVALDGNGKAYVNVPWTDTNTTYDLSPYAKTADVNVALSKKVDVVSGKGLSTEDFTAALKTKLNGIATGATADSAIPISVIDALN